MPIEDADLAEITKLLSPERLGKLHELTGNSRAAIELHQKTLRLGADLMNIIAVIEIALRNSICDNLGQHFGQAGWLLDPPAPFKWKDSEEGKITQALDSARRAEYSKLSQADKHALDASQWSPRQSAAYATVKATPRAYPGHRWKDHCRADLLHLEAGRITSLAAMSSAINR
ncbi:hypothetical protein CN198_14200 [Sinorhizobium meliloti]|uniref:hypothetical protein n=1 Tax=Rhizobium meliloti TaxID=382 RepID=UPI000FDB7FC0|nr:hypothetical protein [Sinorhizobium meliloti]RVH69209.1 hypothetical protein CN198_14200 [Sinorhizobium meliloti]